jgi:hypothetical protein
MTNRIRARRRDGSCKTRKAKSKTFVKKIINNNNLSNESLTRLEAALHGLGRVSSELENLQLLVEDYMDIIREVIDEEDLL